MISAFGVDHGEISKSKTSQAVFGPKQFGAWQKAAKTAREGAKTHKTTATTQAHTFHSTRTRKGNPFLKEKSTESKGHYFHTNLKTGAGARGKITSTTRGGGLTTGAKVGLGATGAGGAGGAAYGAKKRRR